MAKARQKGRAMHAKTATKTAKPRRTPALVPQADGRGALYAGGVPGNAGGTGRPPDAIRARLRGSYESRIAVLEEIADGKTVLTIAHRCPSCGFEPTAEDGDTLDTIMAAKVGVDERLRALDQMAKYGLGQTKELSVEHIRGRLQAQLEVLADTLDQAALARVLPKLREVWA